MRVLQPQHFYAVILTLLVLFAGSNADARKKLLDDKSTSTASIEIKTQDADAVADALISVFIKDGYEVVFEGVEQLNFARQASRMQELAYGKPLAPGSMEIVYVDFFPVSSDKFRVECYVSIQVGGKASLTDANVLPLFGRQYKRILRRVKRALS